MSMFFPLFSLGWQDIVKTTILCKTLLEKGADITTIYKKEKTVSFKELFNIGAPEMEMLPLYQLIFSQPGLPLLVKDKWGLTVIEFARRSNRPIAVQMMEDYVKKYNLKEENQNFQITVVAKINGYFFRIKLFLLKYPLIKFNH